MLEFFFPRTAQMQMFAKYKKANIDNRLKTTSQTLTVCDTWKMSPYDRSEQRLTGDLRETGVFAIEIKGYIHEGGTPRG